MSFVKKAKVALVVVTAVISGAALTTPAGAGPAPAVQLDSRDSEGHLLQLGNDNDAYWVNGAGPQNPENRTEGPGPEQYEQQVGIEPKAGPQGEVAFRMKWRWPETTNGDVKGYPAIVSGSKPGSYSPDYLPAGQPVRLRDGSISLTSPSGATPGTFFPLQLPVNSLTAKYDWDHVTAPTGVGHLSFDLWLQSHPGQDRGFVNSSITHEIMIPLDNWGGYGAHSSRACWWWSHDVTIGGKLYHVHAARDQAPCVDGKNNDTPLLPNFGSLNGAYGRTGWKFIVFQPDVMPMDPGEIDLAAIVNHVGTYTDARGNRWATGNEYLVDAELGVEPIKGTGDIVVHDYKVSQTNSSTPTFPSPPTPTTRVQAETGTLTGSGVSVRSDLPGYEGAGHVGSFTDNGDKLAVSFPNMTAGTYDLRIRHRGGAQQNTVQVNNGQLRDVSFPATGDAWAVKTVPWVTLADGANVINLIKGWGYMDVDYVEVVPVDPPVIQPPPPASARIQAENGALTGLTIQTAAPGYEGSGYVGEFEDDGDKVAVTFPGVTAGKYDIRIRHRGGYQQNYVDVNGTRRSEAFPDTGDGWGVKTISGVTLTGGANTIAVSKEWGWFCVDYLEIVPSNAPSTDTATRKQAENGALTGVISQTQVAGYEGNGYVGPFANAGDKVTVDFTNVTAGSYDIRIRYHSGADQQNHVAVNGSSGSQLFTATGSGWGVKTLRGVALTGGTNTVAIIKDWGWFYVDSVEIVPTS
ncbi:MAG TPA: CBM35 domain-containing protein [Jatrophihabitans sp.]|jgi:hypothetical protein|uniref:CBM35 domain-containing protein n=1 Tax=Jatrophihabitans sp. TaxID=1932789 RepID=UPI002EDC0ADE